MTAIPSVVEDDSDFFPFLRRFEEGIRRFINGDAAAWKEHASHRDV
jgi:hypothetical protein